MIGFVVDGQVADMPDGCMQGAFGPRLAPFQMDGAIPMGKGLRQRGFQRHGFTVFDHGYGNVCETAGRNAGCEHMRTSGIRVFDRMGDPVAHVRDNQQKTVSGHSRHFGDQIGMGKDLG